MGDVWDPDNPSDKHRIPYGWFGSDKQTSVTFNRSVHAVYWLCDGMDGHQRVALDDSNVWNIRWIKREKVMCLQQPALSGRIYWATHEMVTATEPNATLGEALARNESVVV